MKNKFKELKDNFLKFYSSPYGMLIVVSWAVLLLCLIIKLFGGNWFELWWENKNFINFCNYVETKTWLKMVIACLISLITTYPLIAIIYNKNKFSKKGIILYVLIVVVKSIIGWYIPIISTILDVIVLIIIPFIITKNWKRILVANVFVILMQLISILLRNVSFVFNHQNTLIQNYLIQIDYYIMILLFYLYTFKRKENK